MSNIVQCAIEILDCTCDLDVGLLLANWRSGDLNNSPQTFSLMQDIDGFVDFVEALQFMGHVSVDGPFSEGCLVDQFGDIFVALPSSESSSQPLPACDQLE